MAADRSLVVARATAALTDTARPPRRVVRHGGHGRPVGCAVRQPEHGGNLVRVHHQVGVADADQLPGSQEAVHVECWLRPGRARPGGAHDRRGRARSRAPIRAGPARRSEIRRAPPSTVRGRAVPRPARRGRGSGPGRPRSSRAPVGAAARPPPAVLDAAASTPGPVPRLPGRGSARPARGGEVGPAAHDATPRVFPAPVGRGHDGDHPVRAGVEELVQTLPRQRPGRDEGYSRRGHATRHRARTQRSQGS